MTFGIDPAEIVVCALRPAGSWSHLGSLVGFVVVAWFVSPERIRGRGRTGRADAASSASASRLDV